MSVTKSPRFELQKMLVCKFVKPETVNWPREMNLTNRLIERYPDPDFWMGFETPGWRVNSLAFFISGRGAEMLQEYANKPVLQT